MITENAKRKIRQIVSVFETSSLTPKYGQVTVLQDGPKDNRGLKQFMVTYGAHQTTEASHLKELISGYCDAGGRLAKELRPYIPQIGKYVLHKSYQFRILLRQAGDDEIMQELQEKLFEKRYWNPAYNFFLANLFTCPLSMAVIYDSYIHSGGIPMWLRDRFGEKTPLNDGDEKAWATAYVNTRDRWLESHPDKILRNTDYRTDCWKEQIAAGNWDLSQPVKVKFNSANQTQWITIN